MFSKGDKDKAPSTQPETAAKPAQPLQTPGPIASAKPARGGGAPSIISADLKVVGNLESNGDIQVDGTVQGDILSHTVTVTDGAHIEGAIVADTAHINGSVKGQIKAPRIVIAKSAKVVGDVVHETLTIEAGAHLEGQYRRIESEKAASASKSAAKPADQPAAAKPAAASGNAAPASAAKSSSDAAAVAG